MAKFIAIWIIIQLIVATMSTVNMHDSIIDKSYHCYDETKYGFQGYLISVFFPIIPLLPEHQSEIEFRNNYCNGLTK